MAVFSAGYIEYSINKKALRKKIYEKAKSELDSPAMKISTKGGSGFVNFIAFLPKEKISKQNVLQTVQQCQEKCVVVFELDYKQVAVVCEEGMIMDYILDKPKIFAKERGYEIKFADNFKGQTLQYINLQKQKSEIVLSSLLMLFCIVVLAVGLLGGYRYIAEFKQYESQKMQLQSEYETIVNRQLSDALKQIEKIDSVAVLNEIERVTKNTDSRLRQIALRDGRFCVQLANDDIERVKRYNFEDIVIVQEEENLFGYCYEKN